MNEVAQALETYVLSQIPIAVGLIVILVFRQRGLFAPRGHAFMVGERTDKDERGRRDDPPASIREK